MNITISYLRNLAIAAIVLHHSMLAFGGWPPNHGIEADVPLGAWYVSDLLKNFGLGVFTFISGFVLFYQSKKTETFGHFLLKKVKRILMPCLFWACIYGLFFSTYMYISCPSAINGTHLWYLPMLFLCIVVTSSHFYSKYPYAVVAFCYLLFLLLSKFTHFRTFTEYYIYFPVFYAGFLFHRMNLDEVLRKNKRKCLMVLSGGAILWLLKAIEFYKYTWTINMLVISLISYVGVLFLISRVNKINKVDLSLTKQSFSIYLLHQFVINLMLGYVGFEHSNFYFTLCILFCTSFFLPWLLSECCDLAKRKIYLWKSFIL